MSVEAILRGKTLSTKEFADVESLERKQMIGDWVDHLIVKDSNELYGNSRTTKM